MILHGGGGQSGSGGMVAVATFANHARQKLRLWWVSATRRVDTIWQHNGRERRARLQTYLSGLPSLAIFFFIQSCAPNTHVSQTPHVGGWRQRQMNRRLRAVSSRRCGVVREGWRGWTACMA